MANFWPLIKEFQNNFEIKVNYIAFYYCLLLFILLLLIAAITPGLKQKAFDSPVPNLLALCNNKSNVIWKLEL